MSKAKILMLPPSSVFPLDRRVVSRKPEGGTIDHPHHDGDAEQLTLACGHKLISMIPFAGDFVPCSQCLDDYLESVKWIMKARGKPLNG